MIDHVADSVLSAATRTRIATLLINTRRNARTLGVDGTLRPAVRRCSDVVFETRTRRTLAANLTDGIRPARTRFARSDRLADYDRRAPGERIPGHAFRTTADRVVIDHLAPGVDSTGSWARIHAFVIETGFGERTLRADDAFWATTGRVSDQAGLARADSHAVIHSTEAVGAARRWAAWVAGWF